MASTTAIKLIRMVLYLSNASSGTCDYGLDHFVEVPREGSCDAGAG
jgi:hypothetical protein